MEQEGGSSPGPSLARDLWRSADPGGPGNPLLRPPSLALSPGATTGKRGPGPVERGHRTVRLKPGAFKIGSTPRRTPTQAHRAPCPHRVHTRSQAEVPAVQPGFFPEGAGVQGAPRETGRGQPCEASTGRAEAPTTASHGTARPRSPSANSPGSRGTPTGQSAHKRPGPLYGKEISLK